MLTQWVETDGGRKHDRHGPWHKHGDCVTRAIAIACHVPYWAVAQYFRDYAGSDPDKGVYPHITRNTLGQFGLTAHETPPQETTCYLVLAHDFTNAHIAAAIGELVLDAWDSRDFLNSAPHREFWY